MKDQMDDQCENNEIDKVFEEIYQSFRELGIEINSTDDLLQTSMKKNEISSAIWKHYSENYLSVTKETICSAINKFGITASIASDILDKFVKEEDDSVRWKLACTCFKSIPKKELNRVLEIVAEKKYGKGRQMLVFALGMSKLRSEKSVNTLISLLNDEDVVGHALESLSKIGDIRAKTHIEPFLTCNNAWHRRVAKKAMQKIEK